MELAEIRKEIDGIDEKLVGLLLKRMSLSESVAEYKKERSLPILNRERENEIIEKVASASGEYEKQLCRIFEEILAASRARQEEISS